MNEAAITEAASKKRGRPRKYEINQPMMHYLCPDVKTTRHQQNRWLSQQAFSCLINSKADKVKPGVEEIVSLSDKRRFRVGLMEQLGRMQMETGCSDAAVLDHARELNKLFINNPKMTTRKAVEIMRIVRAGYRTQRSRKGGSNE